MKKPLLIIVSVMLVSLVSLFMAFLFLQIEKPAYGAKIQPYGYADFHGIMCLQVRKIQNLKDEDKVSVNATARSKSKMQVEINDNDATYYLDEHGSQAEICVFGVGMLMQIKKADPNSQITYPLGPDDLDWLYNNTTNWQIN